MWRGASSYSGDGREKEEGEWRKFGRRLLSVRARKVQRYGGARDPEWEGRALGH